MAGQSTAASGWTIRRSSHRLRVGSDVVNPARPIAVLCLAVTAAMVVLLVTACSSRTGNVDSDAIAVVPPNEESLTVARSGTSSSDPVAPVSGGTLKVISSCTESLDPAIGDCHALFDEVYARLVSFTDDPAMPVVADLADSYRVSDDGRTYTFTLRRELKFSDGSPLSAQDFKWSWERALSPETGSPNARSAFGSIVGADEVMSGESDELRGVEVVDDRTLRVHLSAPSRAFLFSLADHVATPLKRDNVEAWGSRVQGLPSAAEADATSQLAYEAAGPGQLPIGTGPFRFSEGSIRGIENLKIERNPFTHGTMPHLDSIEFVKDWIEEGVGEEVDLAEQLLALYQSGAIDIAHFAQPDTVTADGTNRVRKLPDGVVFLAFNTAIAPFDDIEVRRAIIAASDVTGVQEGGAALSLMWPGVPGYIPELSANRYDPEREFQPDVRQDLQSLDPLGWCIWTNESGGTFALADVEPHFDSWQDATGLRIAGEASGRDDCPSEFGIIHAYVKLLYPDPHAIFEAFPRMFPEAVGPYAQVRDMISDAESTADSVRRLERYAEIEKYLHEQALVLPTIWTSWSIPEHVRNTVRGYEPGRYGGSVYSNVWLDESAPSR